MARGPAALLAAAVALAFLTAGASLLPELEPPARAALVAAVPGVLLLGVVVHGLGPLVRTRVALGSLLGAGAILTAVTTVFGSHGAGTVPETLLAVAAGLVFARTFDAHPFVLAIPVLLAAIDLYTTLSGEVSRTWPMPVSGGDALMLDLPSWAVPTAAGQVPVLAVGVMAALQGYAEQGRLRPLGTAVAMTVGLACAYLLEWRTGDAAPFTAFVCLAFLFSWSDLLPRWLRAGGAER